MQNFNLEYWENLYKNKTLGWDIGYVSPPLKKYFDQLNDNNIKILVPGAGSGYEVEYLFKNGFKNVFYSDFSVKAQQKFLERCPDFPKENILSNDFFKLKGQYDLIVEQTFFTSFYPTERKKFVRQIYNLLITGGKYFGLFFTHEFGKPYPPFGATKKEYEDLFKPFFYFKIFEIAYNSIKPRKGREYFFVMVKQ